MYYLRRAMHSVSWAKSASMDASRPIRIVWFEILFVVILVLALRQPLGFAFDVFAQLLMPFIAAAYFFRKGGKRIGAMRMASESNKQVQYTEWRCSDPPLVR